MGFPGKVVSRRCSLSRRAAGCFEAIVHDLRAVLRFAAGREPEPTAVVLDSRTIQSTGSTGSTSRGRSACGIFGETGTRQAGPIPPAGPRRLEYRGYGAEIGARGP